MNNSIEVSNQMEEKNIFNSFDRFNEIIARWWHSSYLKKIASFIILILGLLLMLTLVIVILAYTIRYINK
jgi:maltodextrin utilization protein YvdJ